MMGAAPVPVPGRTLQRLFTPGARLGWTYRDLRQSITPFPEPEPDPQVVREQAAERAASAQIRYARARRWLIKPSLAMGLILLLLAGYDMDRGRAAAATVILTAAVLVPVSGLGYTKIRPMRPGMVRDVGLGNVNLKTQQC